MINRNMIDKYLDGWRAGDASMLLEQTAEEFFFDDPNRGRIERGNYKGYVAEIWAEAKEYRGNKEFDRLEDLSEIVVSESNNGTVNVWFWWEIAGTPIEGASLVKVSPAGIVSETICYYGSTSYRKRATAP